LTVGGHESAGPDELEEVPGRIDVALALPQRAGRLLVARRQSGLHLAGRWEFPGGKILPGEEPAAAARRELVEETGLVAGELEPLVVVVHDYADRPVRLHAYLARDPDGYVRLDTEREWGWMTLDELAALDMPEANRNVLRALQWRL